MRTVVTWTVPVIDLKAIGQNNKTLRKSAGISVRDLQTVLGFTIDEILVTDCDEAGDGKNYQESLAITGIYVQW